MQDFFSRCSALLKFEKHELEEHPSIVRYKLHLTSLHQSNPTTVLLHTTLSGIEPF